MIHETSVVKKVHFPSTSRVDAKKKRLQMNDCIPKIINLNFVVCCATDMWNTWNSFGQKSTCYQYAFVYFLGYFLTTSEFHTFQHFCP